MIFINITMRMAEFLSEDFVRKEMYGVRYHHRVSHVDVHIRRTLTQHWCVISYIFLKYSVSMFYSPMHITSDMRKLLKCSSPNLTGS